jgi:putative ABC transport system substrate-binding protein
MAHETEMMPIPPTTEPGLAPPRLNARRKTRPTSSDDKALANRGLVIELALKNRLPAMSAFREITEIGGLMSYGSVRVDRFQRTAIYVGKILKGARPADLPTKQPTKYDLVINLKTARSLNLEISRDLLLVADEVIE